METTLVFLKPDAVQRALLGRILARFEAKGLQVVGAKMMQITPELAREHYAEHVEKPFYPSLLEFVTSSPVMVLALRGYDATTVVRKMVGKTNGREAESGTIRGDFGMSGSRNLVHASDSPESAEREMKLWFRDEEIVAYPQPLLNWLYDPSKLGATQAHRPTG
ncbi:MAG: nucleoside-diphosphate kinase [Phycisphaeraceae bacterium]